MKKFDFEKAKAGFPVVRKDGKPAKIVFISDNDDEQRPILYVYKTDNGTYQSEWVDKRGKFYNDPSESAWDLGMASIKVYLGIKKTPRSDNMTYETSHAITDKEYLVKNDDFHTVEIELPD